MASGREVAVKVESIRGALDVERRALESLTKAGGPSPRLRAAGTLDDSGEYPGAVCLVTDRVAGDPPTTTDGWTRMGRALARLDRVPWQGVELATQDHDGFLGLHQRRVDEVAGALGRDLQGTLPATPPSYRDSPLILTHGDPGPGNFLDDGAHGSLIDWEDARVAPRGLDLGRATFIALLGSGPEGYLARETQARAHAVATGFLTEIDDWSPGEDELSWWLSVAGIQFAHWRLEGTGAPRVPPWLEAVAVLDSALAEGPARWGAAA